MAMKKKKCNSIVQLVYKFYAIYNRTDTFFSRLHKRKNMI